MFQQSTYPGSFRAIGSKYKVSGVTVSNVRKTFCQTGENLPLYFRSGVVYFGFTQSSIVN